MSAKKVKELERQLAELKLKAAAKPPKPAKKARKRRKAAPASTMAGDGSMTISRREYVMTVSDGKFGSVLLDPTSFTFLARLGKIFERVVWRRAVFVWVPSVGMNNSGSVVMGFDWDSKGPLTVRADIYALTPVASGPVWQRQQLTLPAGRIMGKKFYTIGVDWPGNLWIDVSKGGGELWLEYSILLMGTK